MKTFIRNIKKHWRLAVICAAVFLIVLTVAVILLREPSKTGSKSERQGYLLNTDYPVYVTKQEQNLLLELDGSESVDLQWEISFSDETIAAADHQPENRGKRKVVLTPLAVGFTTVSFMRTGEISGYRYDAVRIDADIYVSGDTEAERALYLNDVRLFASDAGAADTATPYLLVENKVILPNGGDWTLTAPVDESGEDGAEQRYYIVQEPENEGTPCIVVFRNLNAPEPESGDTTEQDTLLLRSESLGIEKRIECYMNAERNWYLRNAEG